MDESLVGFKTTSFFGLLSRCYSIIFLFSKYFMSPKFFNIL